MSLISPARLRRVWDRLRPLPRPRYVTPTPRVSDAFQDGVYQNPNVMTFAAAALSEDASFVAELINGLTPDEEFAGQRAYYLLAAKQFGPFMRYADLTTTLWAATTLIQPSSYLEIGVRRGRSSCVVGKLRTECSILGFDLWQTYGGKETPGPEFVRGELQVAGHTGSVEFVSGNSADTVRAYLGSHPDLFFDVITVDGDHSLMGAAQDLSNVLPRLKVGGIILFDDIARAVSLQSVWHRLVATDGRYASWEYTDDGSGVAAAIRIGDGPMLNWRADSP